MGTKEGLVRGCSCRGTSGFVHVSCLTEQAKILFAEAEENHLNNNKVLSEKWARWHTCSICKQDYHGVVKCALGWACWKTYLGRQETIWARCLAMTALGNGLCAVNRHADALVVKEAELATYRRIGVVELEVPRVQSNLANTYAELGRLEEATYIRQHVYSRRLELV